MTTFRVIDFETTGAKRDDHPAQIVEFGIVDVLLGADDGPSIVGTRRDFVSSGVPVELGARATHHITDEQIETGIPVEHAMLALQDGGPDFFVAHNASFEQQFFSGGKTPWICTYKVALRLWPELDGHSNSFLLYALGIDRIRAFDLSLALPAHRALPDAYVTAFILMKMLSRPSFSLDLAVQWSREPPFPARIGFGKHRGTAWGDLQTSYLEWIINKSDLDSDTKWRAKEALRTGS